jgi:hypothetical protein
MQHLLSARSRFVFFCSNFFFSLSVETGARQSMPEDCPEATISLSQECLLGKKLINPVDKNKSVLKG